MAADPKIFVRKCSRCRQLAQTADQTGETPCDECASKKQALPLAAPRDEAPAAAEEAPEVAPSVEDDAPF